MKDGGTIAIDWMDAMPTTEKLAPLLIMIPGLSGDTQETYLTSMAREGRKYGY